MRRITVRWSQKFSHTWLKLAPTILKVAPVLKVGSIFSTRGALTLLAAGGLTVAGLESANAIDVIDQDRPAIDVVAVVSEGQDGSIELVALQGVTIFDLIRQDHTDIIGAVGAIDFPPGNASGLTRAEAVDLIEKVDALYQAVFPQ